MGAIKEKLVAAALAEWEFFKRSTRSIDDVWKIGGDEAQAPYTSHISRYWAAVGLPDWTGKTDQPWSAAFVSWCFEAEGAQGKFRPNATHSAYIDAIRRHAGASADLVLKSPTEAIVEVGDLIWNPRKKKPPTEYVPPANFNEAIQRLKAGQYFDSHVDIVVEVTANSCSSIGGNVSNLDIGGSVTRSTWRVADGKLSDPRKQWIGIVKNGL